MSEPARGDPARIGERQVVLAEVDHVGADRQRDVEAIVHAKRDAGGAAAVFQPEGGVTHRRRAERLRAQLQAARTRRQQGLGPPLHLG